MNGFRCLRTTIPLLWKYQRNVLHYPLLNQRTPLLINNSGMASSMLDVVNERIVWVDLEMTGLDIETDKIIEIACVITDSQLNIIAESGLTEAVRKSNTTVQSAEEKLLAFLTQHVPKKKCPLAGNSIYMDKMFLQKYMPKFTEFLHYRIIDVSSVKELCRRWYKNEFQNSPQKSLSHRGQEDIKESIKELKYYKMKIFK
ncbi:oligoribonuclease, mitochondrial isoform X3 [Octopus bimaculoides]|uniref:oligoribonuclease, mitochondrial isoform X3 n=1 Tax=Octopus bimaculoides TaxID=37653 RepID=UPI00071C2410|nr:oligoribonuclease, mitochondrial isoform X3 [Octopus bimaculoides]|eukprot:XP_014789568.1 PREDICTED: oligoribonuclease, mitochondrial-like isoform X3 [Octopus bimaculoides]